MLAYASHLILRKFSAAKVSTIAQSDINTEGKEQYHQLHLYRQYSPGMVHQAVAGYSTPIIRLQYQGSSDIKRLVNRTLILVVIFQCSDLPTMSMLILPTLLMIRHTLSVSHSYLIISR